MTTAVKPVKLPEVTLYVVRDVPDGADGRLNEAYAIPCSRVT